MLSTIFGILLYVAAGQLVLEKVPYKSMPACIEGTKTRLAQVEENPRTQEVIVAGCVPLEAQEVRS